MDTRSQLELITDGLKRLRDIRDRELRGAGPRVRHRLDEVALDVREELVVGDREGVFGREEGAEVIEGLSRNSGEGHPLTIVACQGIENTEGYYRERVTFHTIATQP